MPSPLDPRIARAESLLAYAKALDLLLEREVITLEQARDVLHNEQLIPEVKSSTTAPDAQ
jgi:hypothetical protein